MHLPQHPQSPSTVTGSLPPAWLRIPQAIQCSGISRSKLYELIRENRIRSASLRDPGQTKATRLISRESLLAYIESHATGGEG